VATELKGIYRALDAEAAETALAAFEAGPWHAQYPAIAAVYRAKTAHLQEATERPDDHAALEAARAHPELLATAGLSSENSGNSIVSEQSVLRLFASSVKDSPGALLHRH
jgi:transposase-like protein